MSWNSTGKVMTLIGSDDVAAAVALQPDGKVLLAGSCSTGGVNDFCALRYHANGTLDSSWNGTGKVITPVGSNEDNATAMVLQPDGKVLLAGYCYNGANYDFCALRYNADGTLDSSWNGTGKVITPIGTSNDIASAMALQPDGKVLLAGQCVNGANYDFCALRYTANGALDASWNGTGKVISPVGSGTDIAFAIALQPDGKVLLAGYCDNGTSDDFCALRYNVDGTLDLSWNGTGKVMTAIGSGDDAARAMALQPDGKVLLVGYCDNGVNRDFCSLRYHTNGTLDLSWNGTGKVMTAFGSGEDVARAMALQSDGKVLVAGYCFSGNPDFCVARYDGGPFGYQNCKPDLDGDGLMTATVDALIFTRVMLGITGPALINGITFPPTATRNSWPLIRDYLVTQCGMSLVQ